MLTPRPWTNQAEAPDTRRHPRLRRTALAHAAMRNCPRCHWRNLPVGLTYLLHRHRSPRLLARDRAYEGYDPAGRRARLHGEGRHAAGGLLRREGGGAGPIGRLRAGRRCRGRGRRRGDRQANEAPQAARRSKRPRPWARKRAAHSGTCGVRVIGARPLHPRRQRTMTHNRSIWVRSSCWPSRS